MAAGKDRGNIAEARACESWDRMCELWALVEGLNWTAGGEHASLVRIFDADLICDESVITVVLLESEGTVSEPFCEVRDGFHLESLRDAAGPSVGG